MNNRGSVLLMCFYVMGVLTIIGAAFGVIMINERLAAQRGIQATQALDIAEAGLEKAYYDLRQDYIQSSNWNDGNINGINVVPVSSQFYSLYSNVSLGTGSFTVEIMNDGVTTDRVWVRSTGVSGQTRRTIEMFMKVTNPVGPVIKEMGWQMVPI